MKKKLFFLLVLGGLAALAFPLSNLIVGRAPNRLTELRSGDPAFDAAAGVLGKKCSDCHLSGAKLPFYASLPGAKGLIGKDIAEGLDHLDLAEAFFPAGGKAVDPVTLAKLEYTVQRNHMPPSRYLLLHWDGALSRQEKAALLDWIRGVREKHYAAEGTAPEFRNEPVQPLPRSHGQDPAKAALGKRLFHDQRLSGDDTVSCATCHDLEKGGTDQLRFSKGIRGQVGDINAPTVFNSGFQFRQFWDGRAADLEEQADGPVNNPVEMGSDWEQVIGKLSKDEAFVKAFTAVYPDGLKKEHFLEAVAVFERTLITPDSPFDRYLRGAKDALSPEAEEGYALFKEHGCATCHAGKILGGLSYERMGCVKDYFELRGGEVKKADLGRYNATGREEDKHKFKVPTLRNVALTFPYFHDGSTSDLEEAVKIMAECQTDEGITDGEAEKIAAFLRSLTGTYEGKPLDGR